METNEETPMKLKLVTFPVHLQQVIVMFMSVVVVTILGTAATDGFQSIFDKALQGGRVVIFK